MQRLLIRLIVNGIALWAAAQWVSGISYEGDWLSLGIVALIFGIVNALIRPILKLLTCPLILATLGLFILVINALMLLLVGSVSQSLGISFQVDGFGPAIVGAIVISIVSIVLNLFVRDRDDDKDRRKW